MNNINLKNNFILVLFLFLFSCATHGGIQRLYDKTSRKELWNAMQTVLINEFGGIERTSSNPPTIYSIVKKEDEEFDLDKTEYKAVLSLSGFNRPYFVTSRVFIYPEGQSLTNFKYDYKYSEKILNLIDEKLNANKTKTIFEEFTPF